MPKGQCRRRSREYLFRYDHNGEIGGTVFFFEVITNNKIAEQESQKLTSVQATVTIQN
ncbi:hypothetical protein [Scytonema sp. PRP1]|uniref:hypothetical protein n=1 Tax=Scytonema sp. PRP1 TaxID=3120513 RepID=UPI002FD4C055